jgi:ribosome-associated protein
MIAIIIWRSGMKFELQDEYIELYKLLKVLDLVDSGAEAKLIIADGHVRRNDEVELRKRAKIRSGDIIEVADVVIEVISK